MKSKLYFLVHSKNAAKFFVLLACSAQAFISRAVDDQSYGDIRICTIEQKPFIYANQFESNGLFSIAEQENQTPAQQFEADCKSYVIEPGWVIKSYIGMPINDFDTAWSTLVSYLKDEPEFIFGKTKKEFSEKKYRDQLIQYCDDLSTFLIYARVDLAHKTISFIKSFTVQGLQEPGQATLFNYWQAKKNTTYHAFYAVYFDRIAAQFVETITNAYVQLDMSEYEECQKEARKLLRQMRNLFHYLQNSEYDARYSQHIKRYAEVFDLLVKEHSDQDVGL